MGFSANFRKKYLVDDLPKGFHDLKCIYIHIPKAGGTSVCLDLFGYQVGHKSYQHYARWYQKQLDNYFVFSIVRNPFDRLYSAYTFLAQGGKNSADHNFYQKELSRFTSFNEFVVEWVNDENIYKWVHFIPQYKFLIDRYKTIKVDYVAQLENIDHAYPYIASRLGLGQRSLPKHNTSAREQDYRAIYSSEARKIVSSVYEKDIEIFGYKF